MPDVIDAFVDGGIILHMKSPGAALDSAAVRAQLSPLEVELKSVQSAKTHLL
jgi:hypothetical protein